MPTLKELEEYPVEDPQEGGHVIGAGQDCEECGEPAVVSVERGGAAVYYWKGGDAIAISPGEGTDVEFLCKKCFEDEYNPLSGETWYLMADVKVPEGVSQ